MDIIESQRRIARKHGLQALIASSPENVAYTLGTVIPTQSIIRHRHAFTIVPVEGEPVAVVVTIEEELARKYGRIDDLRTYNEFTQSPADIIAEVLMELGIDDGRVGVEDNHLPVRVARRLGARLPGVEFADQEHLFSELRMVKTPEELAVLRQVATAAEKAITQALSAFRPGQTERDLARMLVGSYYEHGGEKLQIMVVATGERSSILNASATDRVVRPGDMVRIDMIGTRNGYYSDVCRTAVVGEPSAEQQAIWEAILQARALVLDQVRPGADTQTIYRSYQEFAEREGLTPINFVGHGLGLGLHEEPAIGRYGGTVLKAGMVLCVEPIHVVPGRMGFQLEDEVLVTEDGFELLTGKDGSRELPVIG